MIKSYKNLYSLLDFLSGYKQENILTRSYNNEFIINKLLIKYDGSLEDDVKEVPLLHEYLESRNIKLIHNKYFTSYEYMGEGILDIWTEIINFVYSDEFTRAKKLKMFF